MKRSHNTTHHLIPESRGGTSNEINLLRINRIFHDAIHRVFNNATPHEQLSDILTLNEPVIVEPTLDEIRAVIAQKIKDGKFYEKGTHKGEVNNKRIYGDIHYHIVDING